MHKNFKIAELPAKYYDRKSSAKACEKEMIKLVKNFPEIFKGDRWEKYRTTNKEDNNDTKGNKVEAEKRQRSIERAEIPDFL